MNPVLRREAQTSLRSWKIFAAITLYVGLVAGAAGLFIWSMLHNYYSGFDPQSIVGLYAILTGFQLGLILLTTPALTAGSISGERERQTLDLLLITKMSPFSIVIGKLASSLGIIVLLVLSTVPIYGIVFYYGGISLIPLLGMTFFLLIVSCMVGAISIFFSTILKKTIVSMVLVYLILGFLCGGTMILLLLYASVIMGFQTVAPNFYVMYFLIALNPALGYLSILDHQIGNGIIMSVFGYISSYTTHTGSSPVQIWLLDYFWLINSSLCIVVTGIFTALAAKFIRPVHKK